MSAVPATGSGVMSHAIHRMRLAMLPRLLPACLVCFICADVAVVDGGQASDAQTQSKPTATEKAASPADQLKALRQKAEKGDAEAQYRLAVALRMGQGAPKDDAAAVKWYRAAADQGHAAAQNNLGWMYHSGYGVPQDDPQAVIWFRKAADQGDQDSQYNLGMMYLTGRGVKRDDVAAAGWFQKAAEQGDAGAQFTLGVVYERGLGVKADAVEAHVWYDLASTRSSGEMQKKYAAARDRIAATLTAAQIAEANKRLRGWTDTFGKRQKKTGR
jgi:TPR repeat protein